MRRVRIKFVLQGGGLSSLLPAAKRQLLFGDDAIIQQLQSILKEGDLRAFACLKYRSTDPKVTNATVLKIVACLQVLVVKYLVVRLFETGYFQGFPTSPTCQ